MPASHVIDQYNKIACITFRGTLLYMVYFSLYDMPSVCVWMRHIKQFMFGDNKNKNYYDTYDE